MSKHIHKKTQINSYVFVIHGKTENRNFNFTHNCLATHILNCTK